jgi:hypothetical protein
MRAAALAAAGALAAAPVAAQSVAARVNAVHEGIVVMSFAAKPGVCGDGHGSVWTRGSRTNISSGDGQWACIASPVRVVIGRADDRTVSVRTSVGGQWQASPSETDLGNVSPPDAARYLVDVARTIGGSSGDAAISAAAFADGVDLSPEFTRLVRDDDAPLESRRQALFWLGQGDATTTDLVTLYATLKPYTLREHFIFVISQRRDDVAIDKLIDVARRDPDHEIRKMSMFWLGQTKDPRAVKFLQDLLTR